MSDELKQENEIISNEILKKGKERNLTEKELILDGVVSEDNYLDPKNKYKIMWMLKEGYNEDLGFKLGTDLLKPKVRVQKADNGMMPTMHGMFYVTYGLLNDKSFEEMAGYETDPGKIEVLTKISWVNINKAVGETSSRTGPLEIEYNFWKEILFKQIKTYSPDILIFGGTAEYFKKDWPKHFGKPLPVDKYFCQYQNDMLIISTYHPSYPFYEDAKISLEDYVNRIIKSVNVTIGKK